MVDEAVAGDSETCAQCGGVLDPAARVVTDDRSFCRPCFDALAVQVQEAVAAMSRDVPYGRAAVGAVLGGAAGAVAWWAFTVVTKVAFGLVAIGIGILVGKGTVAFAGGRRSRGLQALSASVALVAFCVASYLVKVTVINDSPAHRGQVELLPLLAPSLAFFWRVVTLNVGLMDLVFAALTLQQAWVLPQPLTLPRKAAA